MNYFYKIEIDGKLHEITWFDDSCTPAEALHHAITYLECAYEDIKPGMPYEVTGPFSVADAGKFAGVITQTDIDAADAL